MAGPVELLLVHSSLSRCGWVVGGAEALLDVFSGLTTTLCLPTFSYCYPAAPDEPGPVFDPAHTPSRVGAITNCFRARPGVVRSLHPSHSLAAAGPCAVELIAGHQRCQTPCGDGTPFARLVERDAAVLMFGATMDTYTLFHTAEHQGNAPYLYYPDVSALRARGADGALLEVPTRRQDMRVRRRFEAMREILESESLLRSASLGRGELLYVPSAAAVHRWLLERLRVTPRLLAAAPESRTGADAGRPPLYDPAQR